MKSGTGSRHTVRSSLHGTWSTDARPGTRRVGDRPRLRRQDIPRARRRRRQLPGRDPAPEAPGGRGAVSAPRDGHGVAVRRSPRSTGSSCWTTTTGTRRRSCSLSSCGFHQAHGRGLRPGTDLYRAAAFLIEANVVRGDTLTGMDLGRGRRSSSPGGTGSRNARRGSAGAVHPRFAPQQRRIRFHRLRPLRGVPDREGARER